MATTDKPLYGTWVSMTTTSLSSMSNSQTVGWQSDRVDNQTTTLANDYEIVVDIPAFGATAPANDKTVYVWVCPWIYDGSAWHPGGDLGTTTAVTGSQGAGTIALPPNLYGAVTMNYTTQAMPLKKAFKLSQLGLDAFDGWSLVIIDFTGAAMPANCVVAYRPLNSQQV